MIVGAVAGLALAMVAGSGTGLFFGLPAGVITSLLLLIFPG